MAMNGKEKKFNFSSLTPQLTTHTQNTVCVQHITTNDESKEKS
jgi:hypothetical protein